MQRNKDELRQLAQRLQEKLKSCEGAAVVITPYVIVIVPQSMENSNQKGDTP